MNTMLDGVFSVKEIAMKMLTQVADYVPKLLGAMAVLALGYIIALGVSILLHWILKGFKVNKRLGNALHSEGGNKPPDLEAWISKAGMYVVMLFVLVSFFQALGLTLITEPLNRLLIQIFEYLPRLLGPAILLFVAWILASFLRYMLQRVLKTLKFDERMGKRLGVNRQASASKALSEVIYWLVFLLFLPAVLDALALKGVLGPVNHMFDQALGFLPNVLAAILILALGWLGARIVQRIVSNLLETLGTDRMGDSAGVAVVLGKQKLSNLIGLLLYILILIPVLIASLNALKLEAVTRPASEMLNTILSAIPVLFGASLILVVAFFVARIVSGLIANLLEAVGFNRLLSKIGLSKVTTKSEKTPSEIVGYLVIVAVMLFASIEALRMLSFTALADLITEFMRFGGQLVLGVVIFSIGLYFANLVAGRVLASAKSHGKLLSIIVRASILTLAGAMALRQMGIADEIINLAFGIVLGAIAVAAALAFGLGSRDSAGQLVKDWISQLKK